MTVHIATANRQRRKVRPFNWRALLIAGFERIGRQDGDARSLRAEEPAAIHLAQNEVMKLAGSGDHREIEVRRGIIWLTTTPAKGDVFLKPGGRFQLDQPGPFVLQALADAEFVLTR